MSVRTTPGSGLIAFGKKAVAWAVGIAAVAAGIWAAVFGIMNWHRGIYAGMHGNDARFVVRQALIVKYGYDFASTLRYANPAEEKTHLNSAITTGDTQVRIYHLLGRRGVHYCVSVWNPNGNTWSRPDKYGNQINIGAEYLIKKGCSF